MEILTTEQMQAVETLVEHDGISMETLMVQAGLAIYQKIITLETDKSKEIAILCGKGNNGGDALVVASMLQKQGYDVTVYLVFGIPDSELARKQLKKYLDTDGRVVNLETCSYEDLKQICHYGIFIDGIFGIGFSGQVTEAIEKLFEMINSRHAKVYAIDIPSGIDANTGSGAKQCLKATTTFALGALKPALAITRLQRYIGEVIVLDIGIDAEFITKMAEPIYVFTESDFYNELKPRNSESYKGTHGKLLCYTGQETMMGAALLASRAAYRTGVGMLYTAIPQKMLPVLFSALSEAIAVPLIQNYNHNDFIFNYKLLSDKLQDMDAALIGCGLSTDIFTKEVVLELINSSDIPLVLDAEALNIIAQNIEVLDRCQAKEIILTPHYGEMARLINSDVAYVQKNKLAVAKSIAIRYQVIVVLKGPQTMIATPEGKIYLHTVGNAGLAKAGSGDGLAGTIASFLAQGYDATLAANMGVFLHGKAADLTTKTMSKHSILISDVIEQYGNVLK